MYHGHRMTLKRIQGYAVAATVLAPFLVVAASACGNPESTTDMAPSAYAGAGERGSR